MATAQINQRLAALTAIGTSVWLDQIRRNLIESGELGRLVSEDSLRGVTSNPAIFEKAILGSDDYDEHLEALARQGLDREAVYEALAIRDVQLAADVLHPVWEHTGGSDGFVSLEVMPNLARDTEATLAQARDYFQRVDRPNVMIKIPGTEEGLPAIEQAIFAGINVNVTLLFSVDDYARVTAAFIRGLERRQDAGEPLNVHSVASFFVSRVDAEVDKRLEALGRSDLAGRAAIANARDAYQRFRQIFEGDRFAELRAAGAPVQRPLWASTGVKNPHYPDTMYVDNLAAPHTVNTMPMTTLLAAAERGEITGPTADQDPTEDLEALATAGIDMTDVTDKLLRDGIDLFVEAMEKLLAGIDARREAIVTRRPSTIDARIPLKLQPAVVEKIKQARADDVARRVWRKNETLWGPPGTPEIANRLGWLTVVDAMLEELPALEQFARGCVTDGLRDAVLLGMGGSSLAPEVIRRSFGEAGVARADALALHVLDSTVPDAVLAVERAIDPERTLFVVSTKSGETIETLSLFAHFYARVSELLGDGAGSRFAAITDPGSPLVKLAERHCFRHTFLNDPEIGSRYSALSYFGLVPAALMGGDVDALLDGAGIAEQTSVSHDSTEGNAGLWLGVALSALAQAGRDKLTLLVSEPLSSFGLWVEQLIAESTGKQGKGILPVVDEPLADPDRYGEDRVFAYLRNVDSPDEQLDAHVKLLGDAGHPVMTFAVHGPTDLGRIFFIAEFGTAVAGWGLQINPFDQPNVQQAKDATKEELARCRADGALPHVGEADDAALAALFADGGPPSYVAILGYAAPSPALDEAAAELRATIRDATRAATTFGYGPRYLHSTGQFHKGGPRVGRFLVLTHDAGEDVDIPGAPYTFATLERAQAIGDLRTLRELGLPAERVHLGGDDPAAAVRELTDRIRGLLA